MPTAIIFTAQPLTEKFIEPHRNNVLIHYLGDVFDWHGYVKFLSLAALRDTSTDVPLERLFVEPHLGPQHLAPDVMESTPPPPTQPLAMALSQYPRILLLGDPGSGKSTVVNWICVALSRGSDSPLSRIDGPLVPIPMVLRELGFDREFARLRGAEKRWQKLLDLFLSRPVATQLQDERKRHKQFEASLLGQILASGQAFFLLDGIDEIGNVETRKALREAVWEGMRRYPRCRWVMTSRIVGYEEVPFEGEEVAPIDSAHLFAPGFDQSIESCIISDKAMAQQDLKLKTGVLERFYITPFSDAQVEQFTRLWWRQHERNPHLAGTRPSQFLVALRQSHGVRSLARLPHLLTMVALIYRVRAELPDGRALLYNFISDAYLGTLDKERGLDHLRPIPHSVEEMRRWLAAIGWHLQRRRGTQLEGGVTSEGLIDRDDLLDVLSEVIKPESGDEPRRIAELFLEYAGRRSGLLLPRGQDASGRDRYAFIHLSFQEYFAAQFLRDYVCDPDWLELDDENEEHGTRLQDVRRYAGQALWRETLIFLWESATLTSQVLPKRLLVRLFDWKRDEALWSDFAVPTIDELRSTGRKNESHPFAQMVALVAALSVNPHVSFDDSVRDKLLRLCWTWELRSQKQTAGELPQDNAIARYLLARPSSVAQAAAVLKRVAENQQATNLSLSGCTGLSDLTPLAGLPQLRALFLSGCTGLSDLTPLAGLAQLRALSLSGCTGLSDLSPLGGLPQLSSLDLSDCTGVSDLSPLAGLPRLRALFLDYCTGLSHLSPLAGLPRLDWLSLSGCSGLSDLSPLAGLTELHTLYLDYCTGLSDLSPLAGLTRLSGLSLHGCTGLSDLSPLTGLTDLRTLDLDGCTSLPREEIEELYRARPMLAR